MLLSHAALLCAQHYSNLKTFLTQSLFSLLTGKGLQILVTSSDFTPVHDHSVHRSKAFCPAYCIKHTLNVTEKQTKRSTIKGITKQ